MRRTKDDKGRFVWTKESPSELKARFEKFIMPIPECGCWIWMGMSNRQGYGMFTKKSRHNYMAHRISWGIYNGDIPNGLFVLHRCDTPACVNPRHLFLGTLIENRADCVKKGRQCKGETCARSRLSKEDVIAIRLDSRTGLATSKDYGVTESNVLRIRAYKTWKHIKADLNGQS